MQRREFITVLGGAAAAGWAFEARTQQPERMRRIGILLRAATDDAEDHSRIGALLQALAVLGWSLALLGWGIRRNVRIDTLWAGVNSEGRDHYQKLTYAPRVRSRAAGIRVQPLRGGPFCERHVEMFIDLTDSIESLSPRL